MQPPSPSDKDHAGHARSSDAGRHRPTAKSGYRVFATAVFVLIVAGDYCCDSGLYHGFGSALFGPASLVVWIAVIVAGIARLGRRRDLR